jgi:hypothetical protein
MIEARVDAAHKFMVKHLADAENAVIKAAAAAANPLSIPTEVINPPTTSKIISGMTVSSKENRLVHVHKSIYRYIYLYNIYTCIYIHLYICNM